jgi:zinc transport system ATP-binding protein
VSGVPIVAETLLTLQDCSLTFDGVSVLDRVSLRVRRGEIISLIGPNGAGKSSLVRVALGLLKPDSGNVLRDVSIRIGYVPQHFSVDPYLPLSVSGFLHLSQSTPQKPARSLTDRLEEVGAAGTLERPLHAISGGEKRRVLLARALLNDPDVLVLDEPASGVDVNGQMELYALLKQLRDRRHCGVLMVSHDLHMVMAATDRVICLNHHICCEGEPHHIRREHAFLELFGTEAATQLAVYSHDHDHRHELGGDVESTPSQP